MLLGILTTGSCCLFTIPCPLVCLVSAQLWQTVSYTTEGSVEFLLSVLEWAEGHSVTPKCNPKCVHVCVGGSEVSTLEGTSLLVWVTCQGVNVSLSLPFQMVHLWRVLVCTSEPLQGHGAQLPHQFRTWTHPLSSLFPASPLRLPALKSFSQGFL